MNILFYKINEDYGCFSNFAPYSFIYDNILWKTSEHYFQSQKFEDRHHIEKIINAKNPMIAAQLGRSRKVSIKKDWELIKDDIMRRAVYEKFSQNTDIREILLSTNEAKIIENTTNDYYWGCGEKGNGLNMLGIILMETRAKLREAANSKRHI